MGSVFFLKKLSKMSQEKKKKKETSFSLITTVLEISKRKAILFLRVFTTALQFLYPKGLIVVFIVFSYHVLIVLLHVDTLIIE